MSMIQYMFAWVAIKEQNRDALYVEDFDEVETYSSYTHYRAGVVLFPNQLSINF